MKAKTIAKGLLPVLFLVSQAVSQTSSYLYKNIFESGKKYTGNMEFVNYTTIDPLSLIDQNNDKKLNELDSVYFSYASPALEELRKKDRYKYEIANVFLASNVIRHLRNASQPAEERTAVDESQNTSSVSEYDKKYGKTEKTKNDSIDNKFPKSCVNAPYSLNDRNAIIKFAITEATDALIENYYKRPNKGGIGFVHAAAAACIFGPNYKKRVMPEIYTGEPSGTLESFFETDLQRIAYNDFLSILSYVSNNMPSYSPFANVQFESQQKSRLGQEIKEGITGKFVGTIYDMVKKLDPQQIYENAKSGADSLINKGKEKLGETTQKSDKTKTGGGVSSGGSTPPKQKPSSSGTSGNSRTERRRTWDD